MGSRITRSYVMSTFQRQMILRDCTTLVATAITRLCNKHLQNFSGIPQLLFTAHMSGVSHQVGTPVLDRLAQVSGCWLALIGLGRPQLEELCSAPPVSHPPTGQPGHVPVAMRRYRRKSSPVMESFLILCCVNIPLAKVGHMAEFSVKAAYGWSLQGTWPKTWWREGEVLGPPS